MVDHVVSLLLAFHILLEHLQLLGLVHWLPIIVEYGHGIQWLGVYLVAIVTQPNDDGVGVEYDLDILCLFDIPIWPLDGKCDDVVTVVAVASWWDLAMMGDVTPIIQRVAHCSGCIWSLLQVVRIFEIVYEWVLSWVKVLAYVAGGATPQATCCWCTDWRSASQAAILALLFMMALVNCSSLHVEHTFLI